MKNVVERAVYRSDGKRIAHVDFDPFRSPYILPPEMHEQDSRDQPFLKDELSPAANSSFEEAVPAYEVRLLKDALEKRVFTSAVRLTGSGFRTTSSGGCIENTARN